MIFPQILPEPEFDDSETVGVIVNGLGQLLGRRVTQIARPVLQVSAWMIRRHDHLDRDSQARAELTAERFICVT